MSRGKGMGEGRDIARVKGMWEEETRVLTWWRLSPCCWQQGTVGSASVIMDRATGRSKGFGFVEMSSDEEAQAAITALNGKDHSGRALTVNEAKPREARVGGGRRY